MTNLGDEANKHIKSQNWNLNPTQSSFKITSNRIHCTRKITSFCTLVAIKGIKAGEINIPWLKSCSYVDQIILLPKILM